MISDVLHDAIKGMDAYLEGETYSGPMKQKLIELRRQMEEIRDLLDRPPHMAPSVIKIVGVTPDEADALADQIFEALKSVDPRIEPVSIGWEM